MVDSDSQPVCGLLSNLLTQFLTPHGWFGLTGCAWFALESTYSISEPDWLIRILSQCVVCCRIYLLDIWTQHGLFGFSVGELFALASIHSVFDPAWLLWTFSRCVVCSQIYSLNIWHRHDYLDSSGWVVLLKYTHWIFYPDWLFRTLSLCVVCTQIYSLNFWSRLVDFYFQSVCDFFSNLLAGFLTPTGWLEFSACAWFALKSTHSISDPDWLIRTLSLCVICTRICSLDIWTRHGWFGLSVGELFTLEPSHSLSDRAWLIWAV